MIRKDINIRFLLTGGGTGGHLFPAVATAEELQRQRPGSKVLFVGTKRRLDKTSLTAYGFASKNIRCYGLKGKKPLELLKAIAVLPLSYIQALRIIYRFKPDIIFGVGGYVSAPVVLAGKSLGVPVVIHEQNSVPGLANRKLGSLANKICLSIPGSGSEFAAQKIVYTGNPVRKNIIKLGKDHSPRLKQRKKTLLILGGSQGATAINRLVSEAFGTLTDEELAGINVIHQTGDQDEEMVKTSYAEKGIDAEVRPFFINIHEVYRQVDLIISRAGATSLAEFAVLAKPAILIPYPSAADNHQEKNSDYYVAAGGALKCNENGLTPGHLARTIKDLLANEQRLYKMGQAMRENAFPDAAKKIVDCCLAEIKKRHLS